MRKRLTGLVLGGALALGVTGAVVVPAVASAATSETDAATEIADRVSAIREALTGLVDDNTITEEQADRVAETLADELPSHGRGGGHGGHGGPGGMGRGLGLDSAAEALGLTEDELREALSDGDTLAEVAEQEGVAVDAVVEALVADARERLAQAVEDGDLTQAEADEMVTDLEARVRERVEEGGFSGHHRGPRGGDEAEPDADPATPTPDADVEESSTSTSARAGVTVAV